MIPVNNVKRSTATAVLNKLCISKGSRLLLDPNVIATPKTIWQNYGFREDTEAQQVTLRLCYVPIMLTDYLQQYCLTLVKKGLVSGMLKKKCNLVVEKAKMYLSLVSPKHRDDYIDRMLSCFEGIEQNIDADMQRYRNQVFITSTKEYPDVKRRNTYTHIMAMLLFMNTMFSYTKYIDCKDDDEMKVIFDIIFDQMFTIFDKNKRFVDKQEHRDMCTSVNILHNRIDNYIGITDEVNDFREKEEAANR